MQGVETQILFYPQFKFWLRFEGDCDPGGFTSPSLRPLASISCRITSIHVFFGLPCALLTCPNLIRSARRTGASVSLRHMTKPS